MDGCITNYENWAFGEPNDSDGTSRTTEVYWGNGEWNDHFATRAQGAVCKLRRERSLALAAQFSQQHQFRSLVKEYHSKNDLILYSIGKKFV